MTTRVTRVASVLVVAIAALAAACSDGEPSGSAPEAKAGGATAVLVPARSALDGPYPRYHDERSGLDVILGTPDLGVGRQRVAFVLSDHEGLVRLPSLPVASRFFAEGAAGAASEVVGEASARFHAFPSDSRGLYAAELEFTRAGTWGLEVRVPRPDGSVATTLFAFEVGARARAPSVGDRAPRSRNRTIRDVPSLAELSTGATPDPALYERTVASALQEGRPLVVVFASPGFCTNALCGPQVEQLSELRRQYGESAAFVHVDIYENPSVIRERGLEAGKRTPLLEEWGLRSDEWTFVVNSEGVVSARFEAFASLEELEPALRSVLEAESGRGAPPVKPEG